LDPEVVPWLLGFGFLGLLFWCAKNAGVGQTRQRAPDARTFVNIANGSAGTSLFPSGSWRGYYCQYGRQHALCDFSFMFAGANVTGSGLDDVGQYNINGVVGGNRVAFQKRYIAHSPAENGLINHTENRGHIVEYRGEKVGVSLAQGIKGHWYVNLPHYQGRGEFHLWPAMPNWHLTQPSAPPLSAIGQMPVPSAPPLQFPVTSDNVCTVCFDNPINVCLLPCGHVAICSSCANRLRPPNCPICRTHITSICDATGNPFAEASAPPMAVVLPRQPELSTPLAANV